MKFYALSFLCFVLFVDVLKCQSYKKLYFSIDDKVRAIYVIKLKEFEYFYFESLDKGRKNFVEDSKSYTYVFGQTSLFFLPGSMFFALYHKSFGKFEFQMNRPAILYKDKLLIPFFSFLECLSNSGIFASSLSSKSFAFKYKEPKKQENAPFAQITPKKKEPVDTAATPIPKVDEKMEDTQSRSLPRLVLTNNERYSLEPNDGKQKAMNTKELESKNKRQNDDTLSKVPPKYYILPPELKNSPK